MKLSENDLAILKYCKPHLEFMWAAKIASMILGCDFRDTQSEIKKYIPDEV